MRVTVVKASPIKRPFKCAFCDKTFWALDDVIRHEKIRHKKRIERTRGVGWSKDK
jgi:hypothetical protein